MAVKNAMEIFAVLDKSNCKKCGEKTCLAFAGAVFLGNRHISECPLLDKEVITKFSESEVNQNSQEDEQREYIAQLTQKVTDLDFLSVATRVGARTETDVLNVTVLGKKFGIAKDGKFVTDLHIIPWVVVPILDYMLNCKGIPVGGEWVSFREIGGGREKYALFKKRGEDVLKQLADKYTDFFDDIIHMFDGREVEQQFKSDVSVVLYPLPLVPIMICYWKPDDGLDSSLNLFFDKSVGDNLGLESAFFLGTGLANMLEKLAEHHGF